MITGKTEYPGSGDNIHGLELAECKGYCQPGRQTNLLRSRTTSARSLGTIGGKSRILRGGQQSQTATDGYAVQAHWASICPGPTTQGQGLTTEEIVKAYPQKGGGHHISHRYQQSTPGTKDDEEQGPNKVKMLLDRKGPGMAEVPGPIEHNARGVGRGGEPAVVPRRWSAPGIEKPPRPAERPNRRAGSAAFSAGRRAVEKSPGYGAFRAS